MGFCLGGAGVGLNSWAGGRRETKKKNLRARPGDCLFSAGAKMVERTGERFWLRVKAKTTESAGSGLEAVKKNGGKSWLFLGEWGAGVRSKKKTNNN